MIRQDFISKYIEELGKNLMKLLQYQYGIEDENFLFHFNEMLRSYYRINDDEMEILLEPDPERDQFLLSDELKKKNVRTFLKAALVFLTIENEDKAKLTFLIAKRIYTIQTGIFQFPTAEDQLLEKDYKLVEKKLNIQ